MLANVNYCLSCQYWQGGTCSVWETEVFTTLCPSETTLQCLLCGVGSQHFSAPGVCPQCAEEWKNMYQIMGNRTWFPNGVLTYEDAVTIVRINEPDNNIYYPAISGVVEYRGWLCEATLWDSGQVYIWEVSPPNKEE